MATNELNELKINVDLTPQVKIIGTLQKDTKISAQVTSGARGKSAYDVWIEQGYSGTPDDFLAWLRADSFVHIQMVAANEWVITHNLNKYPSVTIVDSANTMVVGGVEYISLNQLKVTFNASFSGKAYLN